MVLRIAATAGMLLALSQAAFAAPAPTATGMMKHTMKSSSMKGGSMKSGAMKSGSMKSSMTAKKPLMGASAGSSNVGGTTKGKPGDESTTPKGAPPPHSP